jgi:hypothetical protein
LRSRTTDWLSDTSKRPVRERLEAIGHIRRLWVGEGRVVTFVRSQSLSCGLRAGITIACPGAVLGHIRGRVRVARLTDPCGSSVRFRDGVDLALPGRRNLDSAAAKVRLMAPYPRRDRVHRLKLCPRGPRTEPKTSGRLRVCRMFPTGPLRAAMR